ncbi:MAG: hypothetical protein KH266_09630 [Actinomyces sp.]|nr:hypothetical protein [Actinomyces sp.]
MSDNEFDTQRDRAEEAPDNLVLTGEEIELPGEDSDASAIIGESSEPIHTGEIEAVAIGGLTGRVPAAAPLKPTIEDKISTGELPVVSAPEGDLPVVSSSDEAEAAPEQEQAEQESPADAPAADQGNDQTAEADAGAAEATEEPEAAEEAPHEAPVEEATEEQATAEDTASDEPAPASSNEEGEQPEASEHETEDTENSFASLLSSADEDAADEAAEDVTEDPEPALAPVMTPAQAAAALSEANDDASDEASDEAEAPSSEDEPAEEAPAEGEVSAVGGAAADASTHSPSSRRSMIFGDDETLSPSIPAVAAQENAPADTSTEEETTVEEATPFTEPTAQLPTQGTEASYSFEDQDAAEAARPRRRSLLGEGNEDAEAATLAAIASTAARGDKSGAPSSLDDELFSAAPEITEMPSRTGAHWLSFLLFLLLVPVGWYLAADAGARMTLADDAPIYSGVASIVALGEILGAIIVSAILFATARRSSLGAWLMGIVTLIVGLPWLMAPGITEASVLSALTALTNTGSLGANLAHHLQASGYSGRFALLGVVLMGLAYVSHSARRTGRAEEALRTSIEATNPAGAFYSKRARKKAAKEAARK